MQSPKFPLVLVLICCSCRGPVARWIAISPSPGTAGTAQAKADSHGATNPLAGCSMCHVNIEDEFFGSAHYNKSIGCVQCHGPSEGHLADENNEVKPDELFARENVDRLCGACHACSRPEQATAPQTRKVCINCHGPHDLELLAKGDRPDVRAGASP